MDKICQYCDCPLSEHIDGEECPDYECICGKWIEAINEYAMTCDGCQELTMREDLTMDMKTQLSYCEECTKQRNKMFKKIKSKIKEQIVKFNDVYMDNPSKRELPKIKKSDIFTYRYQDKPNDNPFKETASVDVEILNVKRGYVLYKFLVGGLGEDSCTIESFDTLYKKKKKDVKETEKKISETTE